MTKLPRQVQIDNFKQYMGKELSSILEKEKIDAWVQDVDIAYGCIIAFQKTVAVHDAKCSIGYHEELLSDSECGDNTLENLVTITRQAANLDKDLAGIIEEVVKTYAEIDMDRGEKQ